MKRLLFISLALLGTINAAEPARESFMIDVPRNQVGHYSNAVYLTEAGPTRRILDTTHTKLWHENRGDISIYGIWNHPGLSPLASPNQNKTNTVECVEEIRPEGNRYECSPTFSNARQKFEEIKAKFHEGKTVATEPLARM
jgi:hypothetical protein